MADMTFKEFCRQRKRMCASILRCRDCELHDRNIPCCNIDDMLATEAVDAAESIVKKWAQEHPERAINPSEEKQAKTYEQGLEDAWELAKRLHLNKCDYEESVTDNDIRDIYGTPDLAKVMMMTPQEAMQKLREWEDNNSFKVGDIIAFKDETKAVVMDVESDETVVVLTENGCAESGIFKTAIRKTGRNIADKLNALLEEIGGKQDGKV